MESELFNLNVFTNVASSDPDHCLAQHAIRTFFDCFVPADGLTIKTRVFIDPNPNPDTFDAWIDTIQKGVPDIPFEVIQTEGLIKGFAKSIHLSEGAYAMQLEHDFVFLKSRISHSLPQMIAQMRQGHLNYLRFNKRTNAQAAYDYRVDPAGTDNFPMCRINGRSNNPHLIELDYYRQVVAPILNGPRALEIGLEGGLCRYVGGGHLYGPLGHPRTVDHLDGRRLRFKDAIRRRLYLMRQDSA